MMKDKIIEKSAELFLNLGFKSVTMDDIANEMGISKKTIYQYFETKTKLVEATAIYSFDCISNSINAICALNTNPIEELFKIKEFVSNYISSEKESPEFQLKKYYPKIHAILGQKKFEAMKHCISENLTRGINDGLYRTTLNIDFISRIYFSSLGSLKDEEIYPTNLFKMQDLLDQFLEYHLRGICTPLGMDYLNNRNTTINTK